MWQVPLPQNGTKDELAHASDATARARTPPHLFTCYGSHAGRERFDAGLWCRTDEIRSTDRGTPPFIDRGGHACSNAIRTGRPMVHRCGVLDSPVLSWHRLALCPFEIGRRPGGMIRTRTVSLGDTSDVNGSTLWPNGGHAGSWVSTPFIGVQRRRGRRGSIIDSCVCLGEAVPFSRCLNHSNGLVTTSDHVIAYDHGGDWHRSRLVASARNRPVVRLQPSTEVTFCRPSHSC
jgi:hypothetical protein